MTDGEVVVAIATAVASIVIPIAIESETTNEDDNVANSSSTTMVIDFTTYAKVSLVAPMNPIWLLGMQEFLKLHHLRCKQIEINGR